MKTMKINVPDGYEIDKEKSTFEEIVFKKIDTKPRSWEEFCENYPVKNEVYINGTSYIFHRTDGEERERNKTYDKNLLPSIEYAKAILALCQLISLRQVWIGDWEPDYTDYCTNKYCIIFIEENIKVVKYNYFRHPLSFPTEEMANEFVECFKDLIEKAKILL